MKETASPDQQLEMALNRLDNTERRLIKQPELGEKYCEIIEQYIKKRYLEYVDLKMTVTIVGTYPIFQ